MARTRTSDALGSAASGIASLALAMTLAGLIGVGLTLAIREAWIFSLEHWTGDWRTAALSETPPTQHQRIAIVRISEDTLAQFPYRAPIDRQFLADLVTAIDGAGADTIALDLLFDRHTESDKDAALAQALVAARARVVVGVADARTPMTPSQRAFQESYIARIGRTSAYLNLRLEGDGVVRFIPGPAESETLMPSFSAAAAGKANGTTAPHLAQRIAWLRRPKDGTDNFLSIPAELLAGKLPKPPKPVIDAMLGQLRGRIVFVGADYPHEDRYRTPLFRVDGRQKPGVEIHALATAQIVDGRDVATLADRYLLLLFSLLAGIGMLLGRRHGFRSYSFYLGLVTAAVVALDLALFTTARIVIPYTSCLAAIVSGLALGLAGHLAANRSAGSISRGPVGTETKLRDRAGLRHYPPHT